MPPPPVHPHVRGEYSCTASPRVELSRFTPTCVGNTFLSPKILGYRSGSPPRAWGIPSLPEATPDQAAVHPHVRGEYVCAAASHSSCDGSPPRAWGIRARTPTASGALVGSPPRAWGIRRSTATRFWRSTVHPHVRGEYRLQGLHQVCIAGSPPRAWGIRARDRSTRTRTCGSPPRAWGIRIGAENLTGAARFTPTCVGNTRSRPPRMRSRSVHPHVRGEYLLPCEP